MAAAAVLVHISFGGPGNVFWGGSHMGKSILLGTERGSSEYRVAGKNGVMKADNAATPSQPSVAKGPCPAACGFAGETLRA